MWHSVRVMGQVRVVEVTDDKILYEMGVCELLEFMTNVKIVDLQKEGWSIKAVTSSLAVRGDPTLLTWQRGNYLAMATILAKRKV